MQAAFASNLIPLGGGGDGGRVIVEGRTVLRAEEPSSGLTGVTSHFLRTLNVSLVSGRDLTMEEVRQLGFWEDRIFGWLFSIFAAVALLLAVIGVYGVLSYAVSQRTQEMGVRVALGAGRGDVLRLIVGQGVRLAAIGIGVGLVGSFAVTRVVRTLLFNVTPTDPVSFIGVSLFLVFIAALASYIPARRATAVDPLIALRAQ